MIPALSAGNLNSYITYTYSIPVLEKEEEYDLIRLYKHNKDKTAFDTLVKSHLRQVVSIAKNNAGYGLPQEDLIQEGTIGLIKSIENFNLDFNVRLATYNIHYIRNHMYEYIINNFKLLRLATTKAQRKAFFNLRKNKITNGWYTEEETKNLAGKLNIDKQVVSEMEGRLYSSVTSFDYFTHDEDDMDYGDNHNASPSGFLFDVNEQPDVIFEQNDYQSFVTGVVDDVIETLDDRDKDIILCNVINKTKSALQLGREHGISGERVRQLRNRSLGVIRQQVQNGIQEGV